MTTKPANLRVVSEDPAGRWFSVQFDGDPNHNHYDLYLRAKQDLPADDDPFGHPVFVPSPDGRWSPQHKGWEKDAQGTRIWGSYRTEGVRRTWTSYGGADQGTGLRRTQANQPVEVIVSDLGTHRGPWQLMVIDDANYHPTLAPEHRTDMIEWPAPADAPTEEIPIVDLRPEEAVTEAAALRTERDAALADVARETARVTQLEAANARLTAANSGLQARVDELEAQLAKRRDRRAKRRAKKAQQ
ncbi:MAG: hypothetical protein OXC29_11260 [Rhodococcus sp.]|nr:hypothetical protein [Rhodococcus sp. (in: high G+C Gram-positive bacteria)]